MSGFKRGVHSATAGTTDEALTPTTHNTESHLRNYVKLLAHYHKRNIEPSVIETLTHGVSVSLRIGWTASTVTDQYLQR